MSPTVRFPVVGLVAPYDIFLRKPIVVVSAFVLRPIAEAPPVCVAAPNPPTLSVKTATGKTAEPLLLMYADPDVNSVAEIVHPAIEPSVAVNEPAAETLKVAAANVVAPDQICPLELT
jgi:hypothetical protein